MQTNKSFTVYIDLIRERYCLGCHKIKSTRDFKQINQQFKQASKCLACQPEVTCSTY